MFNETWPAPEIELWPRVAVIPEDEPRMPTVRLTVPLNALDGVTAIVLEPPLPAVKSRVDGEAARLKSAPLEAVGISIMPTTVLLQSQLKRPPTGVNDCQLFQERPAVLRVAQARPTLVCAQ